MPLLLEWIAPRSVVDVGCGTGTWLAVFRDLGVDDVWGIDGAYVQDEQLEIPKEHFLPHDLEEPLRLNRSFDLVMSLEVAEHLTAASADVFVDTLVGLGPVILFSAAIPFQGGDHHVNEQWPAYWARRFQALGYKAIDGLRTKIWEKEAVEWWYAQNMILYARTEYLDRWPALVERAQASPPLPHALVHPKNYARAAWGRRTLQAFGELVACTSPGATSVLVDEAKLDLDGMPGLTLLPYPEKDGRYAGPPLGDDAAIRELERLRREGAEYIAFAWPAFWWLDHYGAFLQHLREAYACVFESDCLVVFDLREPPPGYDPKRALTTLL